MGPDSRKFLSFFAPSRQVSSVTPNRSSIVSESQKTGRSYGVSAVAALAYLPSEGHIVLMAKDWVVTVAQAITWRPGHKNASGTSQSRTLVPRRPYAAITAVFVSLPTESHRWVSARTFGEHHHSLASRIVWQVLFWVIEIQWNLATTRPRSQLELQDKASVPGAVELYSSF